MNPQNKWLKVTGVVLNVLIAAFILFAGSMKVFFPPPDMAAMMTKMGLGDRALLIGWGEIITAVLLVLPWTSPLGGLLASGLWGGIICINMAHGPDFIFPSVLLALTWVGCYLRGSLPLLWIPAGVPVSRNAST
jgi:DoxX-like family